VHALLLALAQVLLRALVNARDREVVVEALLHVLVQALLRAPNQARVRDAFVQTSVRETLIKTFSVPSNELAFAKPP